jgi:hypothetical protein
MHAILLSQYMNNPGEAHYQALKSLVQYPVATTKEGIYYWRNTSHHTLPDAPLPQQYNDNYQLTKTRGTNSTNLIGFMDLD